MKRTLLEQAINRYLALDPESGKRIGLLQGKIVMLELTGISLTVQLVFTEKTIQLVWENFSAADLTIRGTPLNLLHMSLAREKRATFFAEDVVMEGNIELAEQVMQLFDELEIDWEEMMAARIGDVPAYHTARVFRQVKKFQQKMLHTFSYNLNDYVHEEIEFFPPTEALKNFFHEVDTLRMDVDRLEARIQTLEEKL